MSLRVKVLTIFWFNLYSSCKIFIMISIQESKLSWILPQRYSFLQNKLKSFGWSFNRHPHHTIQVKLWEKFEIWSFERNLKLREKSEASGLQLVHLLLRCADAVSKNKIETAAKKIEELNSHASLFSLNRWFWESLKNRVRESLESGEGERERFASRWWGSPGYYWYPPMCHPRAPSISLKMCS